MNGNLPTQKKLDDPVENDATITFDIPAYLDKVTGKAFHKEVRVKTKKAYAIYKRTIQKFEETQ